MTLQPTEPADIGADEARARLDRVRESITKARADLTALFHGRAWLALGHDSWESLCDAELGVRVALPRDDRRELHGDLRDQGLSTRAIAAITGVGVATVHRDLASTVPDGTVDRITGLDGRSRPAHVTTTTRTTEATKVEHDVDLDTGEIIDGGLAEKAGRAAADDAVIELPGLGPSLMTKFLGSIGRAWDVTRYSPERIAEVADPDQFRALTDLADSIATFTERAVAARGTGLRAVKG